MMDDKLSLLRKLIATPVATPAAPAISYPNSVMDPVGQMQSMPDVTGMADMQSFLQKGIADNAAKAARDREIMANLPDLTGTTNTPVAGVKPLMVNPAKPELGLLTKPLDITPTPYPTPVVPERLKETEQERLKAEQPKVEAKVKKVAKEAAPIEQAKPEAKEEELTLPEPTLDDILSAIKKPEGKDEDLLAAQRMQADNRLAMTLGKAAEKIGAGIGSTKSDKEYLNDLQPMVDAPVVNLKERRQAEREKQKDFMDQTRFALDTEKGKQDYAMSKLNMQKAQMDLADMTKRQDPNSDASKLAQASTIDALKRMGRADLAKQVSSRPMSAHELDKAFGTMSLSNMVTAYEAQQNRLAMAKERAALKEIADKEKMDAANQKRLDELSKRLDHDMMGMKTPLGKNANLVNTAERLQVLVAGKKPNDVTNQQLYELASGLDAMLSAGASTVSGREHLLPRGWKTEWAKLAETAGNAPVGAGQGKFVEQIIHTLEREKKAAQLQMSRAARAAVGSYADLQNKYPESWKTMLELKGINPDNMDPTVKAVDVVEAATGKSKYGPAEEAGINKVMIDNNISREDAIKALKQAGKLK